MQETPETQVQSLGCEDPLERKWQPTPVFLSGKSYGQKSLAGYSPWSSNESVTTEQLTFSLSKKRKSKAIFPGGSEVKVSAYSVETRVQSLGWEDPLEKEMVTHSNILAWRIPWMEEPHRL